jgi:hypothetical protein
MSKKKKLPKSVLNHNNKHIKMLWARLVGKSHDGVKFTATKINEGRGIAIMCGDTVVIDTYGNVCGKILKCNPFKDVDGWLKYDIRLAEVKI